MSFSFWRCSAADSGPALAGSAAGFNQPAAICARDIMLFETASPSLCQLKPAVPVHQLTPRVLSSSFCRQRDYAMQRRPEMMTFCDFPSVRLISHLLSLPSRSPPVTRFPLSQLCRCCWTSPPRPTLLWRATSEQCSTSKDWVRTSQHKSVLALCVRVVISVLFNLLQWLWESLWESFHPDWLWMLDVECFICQACVSIFTVSMHQRCRDRLLYLLETAAASVSVKCISFRSIVTLCGKDWVIVLSLVAHDEDDEKPLSNQFYRWNPWKFKPRFPKKKKQQHCIWSQRGCCFFKLKVFLLTKISWEQSRKIRCSWNKSQKLCGGLFFLLSAN